MVADTRLSTAIIKCCVGFGLVKADVDVVDALLYRGYKSIYYGGRPKACVLATSKGVLQIRVEKEQELNCI